MNPITEDLSDVFEEEVTTKDSSEEEETTKNVVTGRDFEMLVKKARKLGAESLNYSSRKNNKCVATLGNGKKVHFGSSAYPDFLIHEDDARRDRYLARAKKIKNKQGELTWDKPESANYWSTRLLWGGK